MIEPSARTTSRPERARARLHRARVDGARSSAAGLQRKLRFALAVSIAAVWASPAFARPTGTDCFWNALSGPTKASVFRAYEAGGTDTLGDVDLEDTEVERVHATCRPGQTATPARLRATGILLIGVAVEHAAAHHLAVAVGVPPERFKIAWRQLRPADRQLLLDAYRGGEAPNPAVVARTSPILDRAARLAGWTAKATANETADQLFHHYLQVFLGIAQSEAYADAT